MPKKPETESEIAFAEFLKERGYESEYEPAVDGKTKNIDFRVHLNGAPLFFEVKEFAAKEIKAGEGGAFSPYKPIYAKIEGSLEQLAEYSEFSSSLVLYAPDASFVSLDPGSILGGLLGPLAFKVFSDQVSGEAREVWFWDSSQGGYTLDAETLKPRCTYVSAIIVLEQFPLGRFVTDEIWEKMKDDERQRLGRALTPAEGRSLVQKLIKEHPDHAKKVMRVLVFEHPDADRPLPREIFNGPYDERYGRDGDHIVPVYVGDEIRKLRDAGVYPGRSSLFKALADE